MNRYYVYILSNKTNSVVYVGITNDLQRRLYEHKNGSNKGFTKKYNVNKLVYYETTSSAFEAIAREKSIKNLLRKKKEALIAEMNPSWTDLSEDE